MEDDSEVEMISVEEEDNEDDRIEDDHLAVVIDHQDIERSMKTWERKVEELEAKVMKTSDEHKKGEKNKVSKTSKQENKEKVEPENDNINIFQYHPHIAKTIKTIESSAESGAEVGEPGAESGVIETIESDDSDHNTLSEKGEKSTLWCDIVKTDQEMDKWKEVQHRKKNMRLKDFQILIPKYDTNSRRDMDENDDFLKTLLQWHVTLDIMAR